MNNDVWECKICGYRTGRSWGQVSWECPRCEGKKGFVENKIKENEKLKRENERLKKKIEELEIEKNPPYLGEGI